MLHGNLRALNPISFQTVKKNEETLKQLKDLNAELEKDVERVRQRDELLKKVLSWFSGISPLHSIIFIIG